MSGCALIIHTDLLQLYGREPPCAMTVLKQPSERRGLGNILSREADTYEHACELLALYEKHTEQHLQTMIALRKRIAGLEFENKVLRDKVKRMGRAAVVHPDPSHITDVLAKNRGHQLREMQKPSDSNPTIGGKP